MLRPATKVCTLKISICVFLCATVFIWTSLLYLPADIIGLTPSGKLRPPAPNSAVSAESPFVTKDSRLLPDARNNTHVFQTQGNPKNLRQLSGAETVSSSIAGKSASKEQRDGKEMSASSTNLAAGRDSVHAPKRRTIVYACRIAECGGWADRQKGMVSAYVLAALLDRDFKLDMPRPCDISVYMKPNQVNWTLAPNETEGRTTKHLFGWTPTIAGLMRAIQIVGSLQIPELDADYVFITWNLEMVHQLQKNSLARRHPWLDQKYSVADIYNYVLRKLFTPAPHFFTKMKELKHSRPPNTKLVCAQVRTGSSEKFDDEENAVFNPMDSIPVLVRFLRQYNDSGGYRIFFTSDNLEVMQLAKEKFPTVFLASSGPITHLDKYKGENACAGFGRTILDQMILSTCDVLIISRSGFGKVASFLRDTDNGLFLFHQSKIVPFLRNQNFADRLW